MMACAQPTCLDVSLKASTLHEQLEQLHHLTGSMMTGFFNSIHITWVKLGFGM
jgi:hypothetical protein